MSRYNVFNFSPPIHPNLLQLSICFYFSIKMATKVLLIEIAVTYHSLLFDLCAAFIQGSPALLILWTTSSLPAFQDTTLSWLTSQCPLLVFYLLPDTVILAGPRDQYLTFSFLFWLLKITPNLMPMTHKYIVQISFLNSKLMKPTAPTNFLHGHLTVPQTQLCPNQNNCSFQQPKTTLLIVFLTSLNSNSIVLVAQLK